jgi:ADP-ribose pyrophosphatase
MHPNNPETALLKRDVQYRRRIVSLQVDTIQLASGVSAIREVVLHPGGVVAVPILDDGRLLLIRQFRYPLGKFILEFPAGKLDVGLTPLETIGRELEEETGYRANRMEHQFSFYSTPGISTEIIHLYFARELTRVAQKLEEGEHITVEVHTLNDCLAAIRTGEIADGKTMLGILWLARELSLK